MATRAMGKIRLVAPGRSGQAGHGPAKPNQECPSRCGGRDQAEQRKAKTVRAMPCQDRERRATTSLAEDLALFAPNRIWYGFVKLINDGLSNVYITAFAVHLLKTK